MRSSNLLDHFSALEDPRQSWKTVYPLEEVLLIVLAGVMAGADDFVEISYWAERKLAFLRRFLPFKEGIPSHDTLNDVMNALPNDLFAECFTNWVAALRDGDGEIVAIDGKTSRRAHGADGRPLHLVSAWAARQRLVLGQEACDEKENEISAIPRLLKRLELNGALVTIDAMGCQHGIAETILGQGADYLLALKGNQKSLHTEIALFFHDTAGLDTHQTTDADHGRVETRRAWVSHDVAWLNGDRAEPVCTASPTCLHRCRRGRGHAQGQNNYRSALLPILNTLVSPPNAARRARPLGHRKPTALGHGRRLP